jgi:hypothetical protein
MTLRWPASLCRGGGAFLFISSHTSRPIRTLFPLGSIPRLPQRPTQIQRIRRILPTLHVIKPMHHRPRASQLVEVVFRVAVIEDHPVAVETAVCGREEGEEDGGEDGRVGWSSG